MFLQGNISVDPSQLTHITKKKPTKAFKRMLYFMTAGGVSDKLEHETFCAVSLLQQLNASFRAMGITNVIRLAKDDVDFYLDEHGKRDDMKEALESFRLEVDQQEAKAFQTLKLVLEHEDHELKYLISVSVERTHKVGVYPIHIEIDGLIKEFRHQEESVDILRNRLRARLNTQAVYDEFLRTKKLQFNKFLGDVAMNMKKFVGVDDITRETVPVMLRPKSKIKDRSRLAETRNDSRPVYAGYHGSADFFLYTWLWMDLAHDANFHVSEFNMIDEAGATMMEVGTVGFDAASSAAMDTAAAFEMPTSGDVSLGDSSEVSHIDTSSSSSWFDGGDWSSDGGDGGSSCSSCSSCGGGCGGCG